MSSVLLSEKFFFKFSFKFLDMSDQNLNLIKKHVQAIEQMKSVLQSIKWTPILSASATRRYEVFSAFLFMAIVLFAESLCAILIYLLAVSH